MASSTSLRAITHRLTATPVNELPYVASYLAASLSDSSDIAGAGSPEAQKKTSADGNDALQLNKLKTRLTSLLQDRSFEGRWTAVVLIKAILEVGRWEIIRDCAAWVRGLLAILSKSDPVSTKKLSIITLTRIFQLTYQYPTLVREITTPNLPAFIAASLNLINAKKASEYSKTSKEIPLLETVLSAFVELIVKHPTIFRPFVGQLQNLLLPIISSSTPTSSKSFYLSQELYILLHHCAPKNTSSDQWASACKNTISSIHQTADQIFRSVVEQWESSDPNYAHNRSSKNLSDTPEYNVPDALGLPPWQGLPAGALRLTALLNLLSTFISTPTATSIHFPLGGIIDMASRLTSVTVPKANEDDQSNLDFSREERTSLYMELPRIHTACIDLFCAIISTLQTSVLPALLTMLEQTLWVFDAENFNSSIRQSSYLFLGEVLPITGRSLAKTNVFSLSYLMQRCCRDLVPIDTNRSTQEIQKGPKGNSKNAQVNMNVDALLNPALKESGSKRENFYSGEKLAATTLLPLLFNYLPTGYIPLPVRTDMERASILTGNRSAMVASVMNPMPPVKGRKPIPSILPFLTRKYAKDLEVECLVRPRLPVILGNTSEQFDAEDYEETEEVPMPVYDVKMPSNVTHSVLFHDTNSTALPKTTQNKRILPLESDLNDQRGSLALATSNMEQPLPQVKKARLADNNVPVAPASVPTTLSEASVSLAVMSPVTSTPIIENSAFDPTSTDIEPSALLKYTKTTAINDTDDSDEEMPTLNIEPDTDDDEDDE